MPEKYSSRVRQQEQNSWNSAEKEAVPTDNVEQERCFKRRRTAYVNPANDVEEEEPDQDEALLLVYSLYYQAFGGNFTCC